MQTAFYIGLSDHLNKDMVTIRYLSMQKDIEVQPYQVTCGRLKKCDECSSIKWGKNKKRQSVLRME